MKLRLVAIPIALALGCGAPMTQNAKKEPPEGWPPAVEAVKPAAAPPGAVVTLEGSYLNNADKVLVGGVPAHFTVDGRYLKVTVPTDLGPGPAKVIVMVGPVGMAEPATLYVNPR